jgi:hypothetical protein
MRRWLWNLLVWLDEGVNVVLLRGNAHETISQRAAWAKQAGKDWGCVLCRFLDWVRPNHCENAIKGVNRAADAQG